MPMIYVKTKEGRRAYYEGRIIPQDKFIPVTDTPYIRRLVEHWEDIEVEGGTQPAAASASTAQPERPRRHVPPAVGQQPERPPSRQAATPTQAAPNIPAPGTGAPKSHN